MCFRFNNSVLLSGCGFSSGNSDVSQELKALYFELLDNVLTEMDLRFGEKALTFTKALLALCPSEPNWLSKEAILPLTELVFSKEKCSDLFPELHVGKNFISLHLKEFENKSVSSCISHITSVLFPYKEAFPLLYSLYASALTFGASTSICENSFSTLSRILSPFRRSMSSIRLSHLSLLAFEKDLTNSLRQEEFLSHFRCSKRKLLI